MAANSSTYRRPGGLTLALQILTGIDLVLDLGVLAIAAASLPNLTHMNEQASDLAVGGAVVILMAQTLLRLAILILRALWNLRLTRNAALFIRFPVTPFWAWAGFFVPVVSLWLPVSHMLALSVIGKRQRRGLNPLCLAWALARWVTCLSGATTVFVILIGIAVFHMITHGEHTMPAQNEFVAMMLCLVMAIAGLVSGGLSLVLVPWIAGRQPTPDQMHHAEIF